MLMMMTIISVTVISVTVRITRFVLEIILILGLKMNVKQIFPKIQENSRKFHFSFKIEVKNEFSPIFCMFFQFSLHVHF